LGLVASCWCEPVGPTTAGYRGPVDWALIPVPLLPLRGSTFVEGVPVVYGPFPVVIVLSVAGVPTCWLPVMVPVTSWLPFAPSPLAASVAVATPVASTVARLRLGESDPGLDGSLIARALRPGWQNAHTVMRRHRRVAAVHLGS
jgi:hypothetical protein